jgi:hypothetical protein
MSNFTHFTSKQNLNLLWNVLLDELHINNSNKNIINNIKSVFESNITPFTTRANPKVHIMELNKQFLSQVVLAVNRLFPNVTSFSELANQTNANTKQEEHIKRITIFPEEERFISEPYKIEDIHVSRQHEFEKEVERKRMEMETYMNPQKPRELDFSDKKSDGKIKAMDSLIAEKMTQRNLEIENFQNSNYNTNIEPEKWLTPKETSVKIEKSLFEQKSIIKNNENTRLKHILIDNNITLFPTNVDESDQKNKKVSWYDQEPRSNLFNKLKKKPIVELNQYDIININDEKQYVEQESIQLPDVTQEEIIRNQITLISPNNIPVLPKTEIIKQLNEMNKKFDSLYEMIFKLTNFMEQNHNQDTREIPEK